MQNAVQETKFNVVSLKFIQYPSLTDNSASLRRVILSLECPNILMSVGADLAMYIISVVNRLFRYYDVIGKRNFLDGPRKGWTVKE